MARRKSSSSCSENPANDPAFGWSDIFIPYQKEVEATEKSGKVSKRRFYLADVNAIASPVCVVPDIGTKLGYFVVKPRSKWKDEFLEWLAAPHEHDDMTD